MALAQGSLSDGMPCQKFQCRSGLACPAGVCLPVGKNGVLPDDFTSGSPVATDGLAIGGATIGGVVPGSSSGTGSSAMPVPSASIARTSSAIVSQSGIMALSTPVTTPNIGATISTSTAAVAVSGLSAGVIAAAVIVPLALIGTVVVALVCYRQRAAERKKRMGDLTSGGIPQEIRSVASA
ncbi:hypothetical protein BC830DRAFT_1218751 [Chytriomyces sp. MP71]|nr:hypothetical protein BC830DRAFT_1218751 [Chytriomyces sp. MP71]